MNKLTKETFEQEIKNSQKPVLIDFYADWCGPCKMVLPMVEQIANSRDDINVFKVDTDDQQELAQKFEIMTIPTLMVFKNGELTNRVSGLLSKAQIEELLD